MPLAGDVVLVAIGPPRPVALDELVRRPESNLARLDGPSLWAIGIGRIPGHMLHTQRRHRPDRQVTVAPGVIAGTGSFRKSALPERIPLVGRALKRCERRDVDVQRTIGRTGQSTVQRHDTLLASQGTPIVVHRVIVPVVVGVHVHPQPHLALVVVATNRQRLALGPRQGRQKHARQDGDDGDDHQQLDQGKTRTGTMERTSGWLHGIGGTPTRRGNPSRPVNSVFQDAVSQGVPPVHELSWESPRIEKCDSGHLPAFQLTP